MRETIPEDDMKLVIDLHLTCARPFAKVWAYTVKNRPYDGKTERHLCATLAGIWFSVSLYE